MNHKKRGRPAPGHRDRRSAGPVRPPVKTASRPAPERRHGPPEPQGSWIYGVHTVLAAIANPERVCLRLFLTPEAAESLKSRIAAIGRKGLPAPEILSRDALTSRLGADAVHQGIALLVGPPPERDLSDVCKGRRRCGQPCSGSASEAGPVGGVRYPPGGGACRLPSLDSTGAQHNWGSGK